MGSLKIACERQCLEAFPCSLSLAALVNSDEPPAALTASVSLPRAHSYKPNRCRRTRAHTHTQPYMHNMWYKLKHVPAITHMEKKPLCPWSFCAASVSGKAQPATPTLSHLSVYRLLPSAYPLPPSSSLPHLLPLLPAPPHLVLPQFFMLWPIILCSLKKQQRSPLPAVLMVVGACVCVCQNINEVRSHGTTWKVPVTCSLSLFSLNSPFVITW